MFSKVSGVLAVSVVHLIGFLAGQGLFLFLGVLLDATLLHLGHSAAALSIIHGIL